MALLRVGSPVGVPRGEMTTLVQCLLPSPVGVLTLVASDVGLRAVLWERERPGRVVLTEVPNAHLSQAVLAATATQIEEYFAGRRQRFDVPLDLRGTAFQRAAWLALADIPFGQTASYQQQAARLGNPKAARAVGAANGRNPVSIILPCHRVVGSNGSLRGFAGGFDAKRFLLQHEAKVSRAALPVVSSLDDRLT